MWRFVIMVCAALAFAGGALAQPLTSGTMALALEAFQDRGGALDEAQVDALPATAFRPPKALGPLDFRGAYWSRATIRNPSDEPQPISVTAGWWDHTVVRFTHSDGRIERRDASQLRDLHATGLGSYPYIVLAPHETVAVLARQTHGNRFRNPTGIALNVSRTVEMVEREQLRLIVLLFVDGIVFGLACYGAVLFAGNRSCEAARAIEPSGPEADGHPSAGGSRQTIA